jgi:hypothetical protein
MQSAAKLKEHYAFTDEDARRLARLKGVMEPAKERIAEEFYCGGRFKITIFLGVVYWLITRAESHRGPGAE